MSSMVEKLPAGFQTDPALASAVDSSVNSVSSGVQAATQTGSVNVGDLLQNFAACFPPIGTSRQPLTSFSDAGVIQPPDSYLTNARELGGEDTLTDFSDFISMNQVAETLSDPKFDHQKSLQSFSAILSGLELPGDPNAPQPMEEATSLRRVDDESFAGNLQPREAEADKEMDSQAAAEFLPTDARDKWFGTESLGSKLQPGEAGAGKMLKTESAAAYEFLPADSAQKLSDGDSHAVIAIIREGSTRVAISGAEFSQRLQSLQGILQQIVNLNQQVEGQQEKS